MLARLNKQERLVVEFKNYNKHARTFGFKEKTFDEFSALKKGRYNPTIKNGKSSLEATTLIRKSPKDSSGDGASYCPINTDEKFYTGNRLIGIATMHKSNSVPVFSQEEAIDISRMRRG